MAYKFRGGSRTVEDVDRRSKQTGGNYDSFLTSDIPFFKPREGENAVRIMPPTWDDIEKWGKGWEIQVYLHRNVGPDNATYLCLDKMLGKKCPVCEARRNARDEDEADALRAQWRALCYVIDRFSEKSGPQVWGLPLTLFREINSRSISKKTKGMILIDGDKDGYGHDVEFTRTGTGLKTKYEGVSIDQEATPIADDVKVEDKWLDYIEDNSLPESLVYYDAEHIEKVLFGKSERRKKGGEDEEDSGGSRRRRGREEPEGEQEDRGGRRRGRDREEAAEDEQEDRGGRRRRDPEEDQTEDAENGGTRRRRGRDAEPEEQEERGGRRRGRDEDGEPEEGSRRRRGREEPEEEPEEPSEGRRRRGREEPEDEPKRGGGVARRRPRASEDEGSEDDGEDTTKQARDKLKGMQERRRSRG